MSTSPTEKAVHVLFSGSVQGVGFRFSTRHLAMQLGVHGWVKNLSNGQVEALIQGPESSIEELMNQLHNRFEINDVTSKPVEDAGIYKIFEIR